MWIWHLPGPYAWALAHEGAHVFEHACLIGTSLAFWTVVLAPYGRRRLGHGATLLFVVGMGLQNGLLGAVLTFAARPLYAPYAGAGGAFGWSALQDQQLAGLIMWVPAGLVHLGTLAVLFAGWMREAEARALRSGFAAPPATPIAACNRRTAAEEHRRVSQSRAGTPGQNRVVVAGGAASRQSGPR